MKKVSIILGILVFLFITVMVVTPIIFKPQLVKLLKEKANKNIDTTLDFKSTGLNLFENFPKVVLDTCLIITCQFFSFIKSNLEPSIGKRVRISQNLFSSYG